MRVSGRTEVATSRSNMVECAYSHITTDSTPDCRMYRCVWVGRAGPTSVESSEEAILRPYHERRFLVHRRLSKADSAQHERTAGPRVHFSQTVL